MRHFLFVILVCICTAHSVSVLKAQSVQTFHMDTLTLYDKARNRPIPVAVYQPMQLTATAHPRVVIFSHGYGANDGGSYLNYSYLTGFLASKGYFVVSIQHELPTDSLLPATGIPQVVRRSSWERGADNILFVINALKQRYPRANYGHITLMGHSNGGDMTALFPQKYPGIADKIITLDNRRMAMPLSNPPQVYSLRSSDQPADEGVLPDSAMQHQLGMIIIKLPHTIHNDMDNHGNEQQRQEICGYVLSFLED